MAITPNQIDETLAKNGQALSDLSVQVEVFEKVFSSLNAASKTGIKTYVSNQITAIKASLDDVVAAINGLP